MKKEQFIVMSLLLGMFVFFNSACKKDKEITQPLAVVSTSILSNYTDTTVLCGGQVLSDEGASVTERGVCWSTEANPTIADERTIDGKGEGNFSSKLNSLSPNTSYFVRAYATNNGGTAYGETKTFKTLEQGTVIDIDGNIYHTVTIGTQVWMVENLKVTKLNDGTEIPYLEDNTQWSAATEPAYCWYGSDAGYKNIYGALYNWFVASSSKLCPTGWHVPNVDEWTILRTGLGEISLAGGKLKETGTAHWESPNQGATNESGFTGLPGGFRQPDGTYSHMVTHGRWWASTAIDQQYGYSIGLFFNDGAFYGGGNLKQFGVSIRCVKD